MAEIDRFDEWRQRAALIALADDPDFLHTAEGAAFLEQLKHFHAPAILRLARDSYVGSGWLEPDDVVNTAIERLRANSGRVAEYAASSDGEPWGYLHRCLVTWARRLWGTRGTSLDVIAEFVAPPAPELEAGDHLTPLDEVVAATFAVLAPVTEERLHAPLLQLLGWLAANPLQRLSYEASERVAAHRHCPELTIEQVTAVMNISWGGRPRQAETSLMGQFLLNPEFRVSDSPTHARAVAYYKHAMRAGALGSRMLTDWTN